MPRTDHLSDLDADDVWAASGDRSLDAKTGEPALDVATGFGAVYDADGGSKVTREQLNEMFNRLTTLIDELNKHGVFEWHPDVDYVNPCIVTWGNVLYISKSNPPAGQQPNLDFARVYWERVAPYATRAENGLVQLAEDSEADAANNASDQDGTIVPNLRQAVRIATRLVNSLIPTNRRLPTPSGQTGDYLDGSRAWRSLVSELADRLLPEAQGTANQVLTNDKTFGYPPSGFSRVVILEGDKSPARGQSFEWGVAGDENLDQYDELELMVRSPEDTDFDNDEDPDNLRGRSMAVMRVSPRLIPQYSDPGLRDVVDHANRTRKEGLLFQTPPMFNHAYTHGDAITLRYWLTRGNSGISAFHGLAAVYDPLTSHNTTLTWHYALYGIKYGDFAP